MVWLGADPCGGTGGSHRPGGRPAGHAAGHPGWGQE